MYNIKNRRNYEGLIRILCHLCNYSINLNLSQDRKVIFNEGDIKPFPDKHKAEIMCLQHYIQEKVFQSEGKWLLLEGRNLRSIHTHTHEASEMTSMWVKIN